MFGCLVDLPFNVT